jgi:hypothetical protein
VRCARSGWFPAHQAKRELGGGQVRLRAETGALLTMTI